MEKNEISMVSCRSPGFYSEKRYLWAVMDLGLGYKFKLGRIFLAGLFFVSGLTEMGEIR